MIKELFSSDFIYFYYLLGNMILLTIIAVPFIYLALLLRVIPATERIAYFRIIFMIVVFLSFAIAAFRLLASG